jgi:hypothetical protein
MWASGEAELLIPPLSREAQLSFAIRPAPGLEPLTVEWGIDRRLTLAGDAGESVIRFTAPEGPARASSLRFRRAEVPNPASGDPRRLSVQLFEIRAADPYQPWTVSPERTRQMDLLGLSLVGAYDPELSDGVVGVWLRPSAVLAVPPEPGVLRLKLSAPRPTAAEPELWHDGQRLAGPLDVVSAPCSFEVVLDGAPAAAEHYRIEIRSTPYLPAEHGFDDRRELGVVLTGVDFSPAREDLDGPATDP